MSGERWTLVLTPPARRDLSRLPEAAAAAVLEGLAAIETNPRRLGKPLRLELDGVFSARRGPYRVLYELDDAAGEIIVLRIDHRSDAYRPL